MLRKGYSLMGSTKVLDFIRNNAVSEALSSLDAMRSRV